jgi:hypothetical protein
VSILTDEQRLEHRRASKRKWARKAYATNPAYAERQRVLAREAQRIRRKDPAFLARKRDDSRLKYATDLAYAERVKAAGRAYRAIPVNKIRQQEYDRVKRADPAYRAEKMEHNKARRKLLPLEAVIEDYLRDRVLEIDGLCIKFIDAGQRGAPDRIVILRGCPAYFVELKRPHIGKLDGAQIRYHQRLKDRGQRVWTLWSREEVDAFIAEVAT